MEGTLYYMGCGARPLRRSRATKVELRTAWSNGNPAEECLKLLMSQACVYTYMLQGPIHKIAGSFHRTGTTANLTHAILNL